MSFLSRREFLAATAAAGFTLPSLSAADTKPKKLVLLAGSPSHGPGDHEFNAGVHLIKKCLSKVPGLVVTSHGGGWPKDEKDLMDADGILSYADGGGGHPFLRGNHMQLIETLSKKGVGIMCAHYAVEVPRDVAGKQFEDWIGGHYEHMFSVNPMWSPEFTEFPKHPIANGVKPFSIRDEWYFNMHFRPEMKGITPILSAKPNDQVRKGPYVYPKGPYQHIIDASGRSEHMMWAAERETGGRGVGFTGGHIHRNWLNESFRKVVLNALLWICKMDVPANGVESTVTEEEIKEQMDPKGKK
jgi:hypothetical protein